MVLVIKEVTLNKTLGKARKLCKDLDNEFYSYQDKNKVQKD